MAGRAGTRRLAAIRGTTSWEGFDNVEVVVEAAIEELQAKRAIFHQLADRTRRIHGNLRVLYMSGYTDDAIVRHGVLAAGIDLLPKPFAVAELLARVRARLRVPAPGAATRWLRAGPVVLDLRLRRADVDGKQVELSFREFLLLQHVMRRAGQACSRGELLSDVWGLTFDPGSNVVDVCVRRLRQKLDRADRIETVRNVGYRFTVD